MNEHNEVKIAGMQEGFVVGLIVGVVLCFIFLYFYE